jgi:hypothetical protein
MPLYEVTHEGEFIGHYKALSMEDAKYDAMDETGIPAFEFEAI